MRYIVKYIYGRYEIHDNFTDTCICHVYTSEQAGLVCNAMNEQYARDGI